MAEPVVLLKVEEPTGPLPAPEAANYLTLANVGQEIQLTIGFVDVSLAAQHVLRSQKGERGEATVPVQITHRFLIGANGLMQLKDAVDRVYSSLEKAGVFKGALPPKTEGR